MYTFPIGVMTESFREDLPTALKKAYQVGARGVQLHAGRPELAPENLSGAKRKELVDMIRSNGLAVSAVCGDFGHGFGDPSKNPDLIERSKRVLELAKDLETNVVTTHIGVVPGDPGHERYKIMQAACCELARFAGDADAFFAVETGPETAAVLKAFLDSLGTKGVAVNMDPANLVMVTGDDPVQAVYTLRDYIVHTHAKDGRRIYEKDPEIVYGVIEEAIQSAESFIELPLGSGDVCFDKYLKALEDIGYRGYLTIEREVGADPEGDIRAAVSFLQEKIRTL